MTPAKRIVEGGRIQVSASGFDPNDEGVLVVLYKGTGESGPIVLDDEAKATENGVVEWSGTLPDEGTGDYIITLQGSTNVGAKIKILEEKEVETAGIADISLQAPLAEQASLLGGGVPAGMALWEWWSAAGALVAIAACTSYMARRQWLNSAK